MNVGTVEGLKVRCSATRTVDCGMTHCGMSGNMPVTVVTWVWVDKLGGRENRMNIHAISGVTFFGLKRRARAATCSAVDSPPHVHGLNHKVGATERQGHTRSGGPAYDEDNNGKCDDDVHDFSHVNVD